MQIIDELEVNKRGPYGGGLGHVSFSGNMDMALGLRTMVIPTANEDSLYSYSGTNSRREWTVHLQVGGGVFVIVTESCAEHVLLYDVAANGQPDYRYMPQSRDHHRVAA